MHLVTVKKGLLKLISDRVALCSKPPVVPRPTQGERVPRVRRALRALLLRHVTCLAPSSPPIRVSSALAFLALLFLYLPGKLSPPHLRPSQGLCPWSPLCMESSSQMSTGLAPHSFKSLSNVPILMEPSLITIVKWDRASACPLLLLCSLSPALFLSSACSTI